MKSLYALLAVFGIFINGTNNTESTFMQIESNYSITNFLVLVNKQNQLDINYEPSELINIAKLVPATKSVVLLNKDVSVQYIAMLKEMENNGITDLYLSSGYRSYEYQKKLNRNKVEKYKNHMNEQGAKNQASNIVAPEGCSEHQTGYAIDLTTKSINFVVDTQFEGTEAFAWLKENSYRYGFIIRYDEDKTHITNIIYEPWHFRYVGVEIAKEMKNKNICLEEYLQSIYPIEILQ